MRILKAFGNGWTGCHFTLIWNSGIRVNPIIIRKEIVLSLLTTKTNGPGIIFLVTLRQVGFVRNLEEYSPESYEEVLVMRIEKKNPLDEGRIYMHHWNRENILYHRIFSVTMELIYSIHSR